MNYLNTLGLFISNFLLLIFFVNLPHLIWHPAILFSYFLSKGLIFYKDFVNMHFPLPTLLIYPFYILSNWNLEIEAWFSLIIGLITLFLIFSICRIFLEPLAIFLTLIFFSINYYYFTSAIQYSLEQLAGLFLTILVYRMIYFYRQYKINIFNLFLDGILISLTLLSGQIVILVLIIYFFIYTYLLALKTNQKVLSLHYLKKVSILIGGILLPSSIILYYFITKQAFGDFFYYNILYYFTYFKLASPNNQFLDLPWNDILYFYSPLIISLAILLLKFYKKILITIENKIFYTFFILVILSIPSTIFSVFHPHHFLYILPINSILLGIVYDTLYFNKSIYGKILFFFLIISVTFYMLYIILPWYKQRTLSQNRGIINDITYRDDAYNAVIWIRSNTLETDKLLVAGDSLLYFRVDRLPSAKLHTVLPWHYKPLEKTTNIIKQNPPDYWVIETSYLMRLSSDYGWQSPQITEFILNELKLCYTKVVSFKTTEIWKRKCI